MTKPLSYPFTRIALSLLAADLGVSTVSIKRSMKRLERAGLIETVPTQAGYTTYRIVREYNPERQCSVVASASP